MFWKRNARFFRTWTFRITLRYTGVFGGLSLIVFLGAYLFLTSKLDQRMDDRLLSTADEFASLYAGHGVAQLSGEFQREAASRGARRVFFRLLSPGGNTLASSNLSAWRGLDSVRTTASPKRDQEIRYSSVSLPGHEYPVRILSRRTVDGNVLQLGLTLRDNELLMERFREVFGMALAAMLICAGVIGWLTARQSMSGVRQVTQTATEIGRGDLCRRVSLRRQGLEIEELASAFNEMLERVETVVREMKEITDHVAHDLRSPLCRIRGMAETTLTGEHDIAQYREMTAAVVEESDRLVEMINTMLEIAQADSGIAEFSREQVDLQQVVRDASDLFLPVAEEKQVRLESDPGQGPTVILGDRARLQRVIANLLDNAVKFTPPGGRVRIAVRRGSSSALITVSDSGPGIEEADLARIFERFFRCEKSRSTPGNGLGLSLASSLVRAHGGQIQVESSPGRGSVFSVSLPLPSPASSPA